MPESSPLSYTVVGHQGGDRARPPVLPFSVVLLHRSNRFDRADIFDMAHRLNALEIISVETVNPRYDLEAFCKAYREIRFLVFQEAPSSWGEAINIAISEARGEYVFVMWSDTQLLPVSRGWYDSHIQNKPLCTVPFFRTTSGTNLPTLSVPVSFRKGLKILHVVPGGEQKASLYAFDYVGLFNRDGFLQTTGFDPLIRESYWQCLDYGLRAWLWGSSIRVSSSLRVQISADLVAEDTNPGPGYERFYARNLLVDFMADHGILAWRRFFRYRKASGSGFFQALSHFKAHRQWVHSHRYRFRTEARSIQELWEEPEVQG